MAEAAARQFVIDEEHLKLLSLGYMISAATTAFFSIFGLFYMAMGLLISHVPASGTRPGQQPPAFVGRIFAGIGLAIFVVLIALALAKLKVAFAIKKHESRTFCMVIAGISCLEVPYGTVLGALSFIVLGRESVAQLFNSGVSSTPATQAESSNVPSH